MTEKRTGGTLPPGVHSAIRTTTRTEWTAENFEGLPAIATDYTPKNVTIQSLKWHLFLPLITKF